MSKKFANQEEADADIEIPELDAEWFEGARQGVYYRHARERKKIVHLDDDVIEVFKGDQAVNEALRTLIRLGARGGVSSLDEAPRGEAADSSDPDPAKAAA